MRQPETSWQAIFDPENEPLRRNLACKLGRYGANTNELAWSDPSGVGFGDEGVGSLYILRRFALLLFRCLFELFKGINALRLMARSLHNSGVSRASLRADFRLERYPA